MVLTRNKKIFNVFTYKVNHGYIFALKFTSEKQNPITVIFFFTSQN